MAAMARRTRNQPTPEAAAEGVEAQADDAAAAPKTRRPRQTQKSGTRRGRSASQQSETGRLIEALLKNRGSRGATQQDLEQVVSWAEGIRAEVAAIEAEAAELRKLGPRSARSTTGAAAARRKQQREARQRELEERRRRSEMNQALLAGVLEGRILLDVGPEGGLVFLDGSAGEGQTGRELPAG
jgi:hypothetical protein